MRTRQSISLVQNKSKFITEFILKCHCSSFYRQKIEDSPNEDDLNEDKVFNLKAVSTWNVWNVPLAGDFPFHPHKSWRIFNDMNLSNLMNCSDDKQINNQIGLHVITNDLYVLLDYMLLQI